MFAQPQLTVGVDVSPGPPGTEADTCTPRCTRSSKHLSKLSTCAIFDWLLTVISWPEAQFVYVAILFGQSSDAASCIDVFTAN